MDGSNLSKRSSNSLMQNNFSVSYTIGNHKKNKTHKDIEKLRRQEMSALHASLRSMLPDEYIKGKRSMLDHMNEAVKYVKNLKNEICELRAKRDELKKMASRVVIHSCLGGLEVVISSGFREQDFQVSKVLEILIEEGVDVVSCVLTKVNRMILLSIHSEVSDPTCIDLSGLQKKLTEAIP